MEVASQVVDVGLLSVAAQVDGAHDEVVDQVFSSRYWSSAAIHSEYCSLPLLYGKVYAMSSKSGGGCELVSSSLHVASRLVMSVVPQRVSDAAARLEELLGWRQ